MSDTGQDRTALEAAAAAARLDRLDRAKEEHHALKAWVAGGRKGDQPATPNLDNLQEDKTMTTTSKSKAATARQTVIYTINGERTDQRKRRYTLGYVAAEHTAGIGGDKVRSISTADLRKILAGHGVDAPETTAGWKVTLPNGVTLGAIDPTGKSAKSTVDVVLPVGSTKAAKAPAKRGAKPVKAQARKAPTAKKSTPTRKAS